MHLEITAHKLELPASINELIEKKAQKLQRFNQRITSCRVVVEAPEGNHRSGGAYTVKIDLTVPGSELAVSHQKDENLARAVRTAFAAAVRRIEDHIRRVRGEVKSHDEQPRGPVVKLFSESGYGFIQSADGREIYFHRNSVLPPGFEELKVGSEVRFTEEQGVKGPQASSVILAS